MLKSLWISFIVLFFSVAHADIISCDHELNAFPANVESMKEFNHFIGSINDYNNTNDSCEGLGSHFDMCSHCTRKWTPRQEELMRKMMGSIAHRKWHHSFHLLERQYFLSSNDSLIVEGLACRYQDNEEMLQQLDGHINIATSPTPLPADWTTDLPRSPQYCDGSTLNQERRSQLYLNRGPIPASEFQKYQEMNLIPMSYNEKSFRTERIENLGEDFLFMHRTMIHMLNKHLSQNGEACVAPWNPDQMQLPQDINGNEPSLIIAQAERLLSPKLMRQLTLNEFATLIRSGFHSKFHMFYSKDEDSFYTDENGQSQSCPDFLATLEDIEKMSPKALYQCDHLLPSVSSHVNPYFWKFHGYIDTLIDRWLEANGYNEISTNCAGRSHCYEWKGQWGAMRPQHHPDHH